MALFFSNPLFWAEEISAQLLVFVTLSGLTLLTQDDRLVRIDFLPRALPNQTRHALLALLGLLLLALALFLAKLGWDWIQLPESRMEMGAASILGSAVAQIGVMSKVMIPAMERAGYQREFSGAVTVSAGLLGPIIPPSMLMIIYGVVAVQPIAPLFIAGIVPGILKVSRGTGSAQARALSAAPPTAPGHPGPAVPPGRLDG